MTTELTTARQETSQPSEQEKNKGGRPSKYSKAFCTEVISLMGQGYSLAACAGDLGISRQTIYEWKAKIPEFSDSVGIGEVKRQKWWEEKARLSAADGTGNAGMIQFGLKNVGREDFRDKVEIDHNSTITHHHTFDEASLSDMDADDVAFLAEALGRLATKGSGPVN